MSHHLERSGSLTTARPAPEITPRAGIRCLLPFHIQESEALTVDLCGTLGEVGCPLAVLVDERLQFETLLGELSAAFVNLPPGEVDSQIESALRRVAEFLGIDRSSFGEWSQAQRQIRITHSYVVPGFPPFPRIILDDRFPWYADRVRQGEVISLSRLPEDAPAEAVQEREYVVKHGLKAKLTIPLKVGGSVLGVISFGSFRAYRPWPDELVQRLRLVGEIFANAVARKRADIAIRESEARFRVMADSAPVMVWMSGTDKNRVYFNQPWLRFTGRTMGDELGDGWAEGVHPDDRARCLEVYVTRFDAGESFEMEYRLRRHDAEYRWVLDRGQPRLTASGEFEGYVGSAIDVTDRKRTDQALQTSENRYRALFEKANDAIFLETEGDEIIAVNQRACDLLGHSREELLAMRVPDLQAPEVRGSPGTVIKGELGRHQDNPFEALDVHRDGRRIPVEITNAAIEENGKRLVLSIVRDVSERRRLQKELEERLRFETVLADLSARFINLPAERVDCEIEDALKCLATCLGLDRSTLFQRSEDEKTLVITHGWAAPGFEPLKGLTVQEAFPWALRRVLAGEVIVFSSVDEWPAEAAQDKATLRQWGPKSNVSFPLSAGGSEVLGALAFGKMTEERTWPEELVQRLGLAAQLLGNALQRKRAEQKLKQALAEVKQLKDRLQEENVYLRQEAKLLHDHGQIIGESQAIQQVLAQVEQVAGTDSTVLLLGETGTGKELLATAIHNLSPRRARAMVKVNCAALPPTLVESELFGREKGAYTGALSKQVGRFELAHGSTIFLDEVGDLPPEIQVKLLRVLQEGTLEHLGSPKPIQVNVRVIAASNRDLAKAVQEGRFREDLFYRLNVFPITVPPLRERREDIALLVWAFVEEFSRTLGKTIRAIAKESMEALQGYAWPGNVRELRNIIERAMITSTGPTLQVVLPRNAEAVRLKSMALEDVEREHILHVLERTRWRVRGKDGAAAMLRLKPTTLESRMAKLGIQRSGPSSDIS